MEHSFRAAVFDLDGTLLDTLQDLGACADEALRQYGFPGHTMEEYRSYIGNGIPRLIARAVPEGTSEQDIQKVLNFYLGYYPVHCAEHTKLFPGVAQTIRLLRQRGMRWRFCRIKQKRRQRRLSQNTSRTNRSVSSGAITA